MVFHDVTYARRLERELSYHASHDALTGLCNRRQFELVLEQALQDAVSGGREHALCYLDLDQFKVVNDTCGHGAGDELLRQLAARLSTKVRESDMLARLGGDEFGVLLYGCTPRRAYAIAEELRNVIREFRFSRREHRFQVGASIGVVAINSGSGSVAELLSAADVACYAAKERGRNRVHVYQTDDHELQERRGEMRLVSRINRALQEGRFRLFVQDTAGLSDDARPGYRELLVRLVDRDGGLLLPMSFIPAAERYGLMPSVDRWVVANACRLLVEESARDSEGIWAINLSGQSVCDEAFLEYVMHTVRESGVAPQRLCFEITETATITNLGHATRFMNVMHGMGCRFALDDFGSGLSSFCYLKQLPVDYLKIDGAFVRDMAEDPIDYAMVEAINRIGHVMGIRTIAEFVEDEAALNALRGLGVDYAQGYWIAEPHPMAADDAVAATRVPGRC
ncbi:MAG TPA: EAL domain-containing protein [Chromatiales bacterium]|nr:EAL domain-containing protein [Chromatiales bacterium]